jgi:hypothetical protein
MPDEPVGFFRPIRGSSPSLDPIPRLTPWAIVCRCSAPSLHGRPCSYPTLTRPFRARSRIESVLTGAMPRAVFVRPLGAHFLSGLSGPDNAGPSCRSRLLRRSSILPSCPPHPSCIPSASPPEIHPNKPLTAPSDPVFLFKTCHSPPSCKPRPSPFLRPRLPPIPSLRKPSIGTTSTLTGSSTAAPS